MLLSFTGTLGGHLGTRTVIWYQHLSYYGREELLFFFADAHEEHIGTVSLACYQHPSYYGHDEILLLSFCRYPRRTPRSLPRCQYPVHHGADRASVAVTAALLWLPQRDAAQNGKEQHPE